jgi:uncharacterized RDD family membrane protein YckC
VSLEAPFGPFFRRWGCLQAAGAPDPGRAKGGGAQRIENDVELDMGGRMGVYAGLGTGTLKWKFPMNCPNCGRETQPTFFCHACDVYLADPSVGVRAGVARRLAAQFLDFWVFGVILGAITAIAGLVGVSSNSPGGWSAGAFFWAFVGYIVFAFWFLAQGKTPGKWLVGIRAARKSDGAVPGLGRMLVRETVGKFASGFFLGLGYFWAIWDPNSQTWHDKIAGTLVVRSVRHRQHPRGD